MAGTKNISESSYIWGHFGAIMADFIIFMLIAYLAYSIRDKFISSSNGVQKKSNQQYIKLRLNIIFWLSIIVGIITLLGLIPIFKDYDEIIIS